MSIPRVLVAITVYNGREFVPECLRSAAAMDPTATEVDVLVLDDASPEPGFSTEIEELCADLGIQYYRTPRNLGIPRNVNMGLLRGVDGGYDYVVIANSDVLFPPGLTDSLVATALTDPSIGSVTSWSNNVSMFSLPNQDPDRFLHDQAVVTWLSEVLAAAMGPEALDVPAGISFAILIPVPVIEKVGLMDPVFGRGYCEETDWSLRSKDLGYRITLAPSCFTYHRGGGTNVDAGLVSAGHTTVPENEAIIDMRYPRFRDEVAEFVHRGELDAAIDRALRAIICDAAERQGYTVIAGGGPDDETSHGPVVALSSDPTGGSATASYMGFRCEIPLGGLPAGAIVSFFGAAPSSVRVLGTDDVIDAAVADLQARGSLVERMASEPTRG